MRMAPEVGSIRRATQRATVDLPEPELADDADRLAAPHRDVDVLGRPHDAAAAEQQAAGAVGLGQALASPAPPARSWACAAAASGSAPRRSACACSRTAAGAGSRSRAPISTTRPDCMTTTRWAISATTPKSWVMNSTPVPRRSCSSRIELQDLRLRRHVERRGRLVGDQQRRIEHQRGRDHDALALAAGDLVRIDVDQALGLGQVHGAHDLQHALAAVGARRGRCGSPAPRRSGRRPS